MNKILISNNTIPFYTLQLICLNNLNLKIIKFRNSSTYFCCHFTLIYRQIKLMLVAVEGALEYNE